MALTTGSSATQTTALGNSYVKMMKLIIMAKAKLVNKIGTSENPVQKHHTWTYDSIAIPSSVNASTEGADEATEAPVDLGEGANDCQIINKGYSISGTQAKTLYQGVDNYLLLQKKKAIETIGLDLEWAVLNGTGRSTGAREMKGIRAFASANTACSATATSTTFSASAGEDALNSILSSMWLKGALADLVIVSSTNKGRIDKWSGYNTRFQDTKDGKLVSTLSVYAAKTTEVEILMHAMANDTNVYAIVSEDKKVAYFRTPYTKMLPESMDGIPFVARMEATLEDRGPYSSAYVVIS